MAMFWRLSATTCLHAAGRCGRGCFINGYFPVKVQNGCGFGKDGSSLHLQQVILGLSMVDAQQRRGYSNLRTGWGFKRVQYTKYRISKPWTADTEFDDIMIAEPSKDDFARFSKDAPVFLRFLKLTTDLEGRQKAFFEFARRCENGLVVEKDVFLTKQQLLKCLWENGYSENEMNAFELAFPADYRFHYPELAVLFDVSEEDCYKYCIRQRVSAPEKLVEVKYKKPENLLSSYGLAFLGVWYGLANQVLSNAWFYSKTFPFGAVFYMLGSYFYRSIREFAWKEEKALLQSAKDNKDAGEELVYNQMKKYASDSQSLALLANFKEEFQDQLSQYHAAIADELDGRLVASLEAKLQAIQQVEQSFRGSLQEVVIEETVNSFKEKLGKDAALRDSVLKSAIKAISGDTTSMDPVGAHFISCLRELGSAELQKIPPKEGGTVVERVAAVFQRKEKELLDSFTVRPDEAKEVKGLATKCKSGGIFDFSKLSAQEKSRLNDLYSSITGRIGFDSVSEDSLKLVFPVEGPAMEMVQYANSQVEHAKAKIQQARLASFAQSFV